MITNISRSSFVLSSQPILSFNHLSFFVQDEPPEYGSANSKEKLVTRWLGHAGAASTRAGGAPPAALAPIVVPVGTGGRGRRGKGVRKTRKPPPPVMLLPAHPASTVSDFLHTIR